MSVCSIVEGAYWLRNKSDSSVLGIGENTTDSSLPVIGQSKYSTRQMLGNQSQMWLVEPQTNGVHFCIRNAQSGTFLDVKDGSKDDGVLVIAMPQVINDNQRWKFEWVDDSDGSPYYRIINVHTEKVLTRDGDKIVSSSWKDTAQQRWAFETVVFPPVYWISHAQTGWYLQYDKANDSAIVGNKISSTENTRSQLWFLESIPDDDTFVIRSVEDDTKVLGLSSGSPIDGTPIAAWTYDGYRSQRWWTTKVGDEDPGEDRVKIISSLANTVIEVVKGPSSGTLQAQTNHRDTSQSWRLHQYPFPSVYWSTLQNLKTGTFLKEEILQVSPSSGMKNAVDYSVQWRFVPGAQPHHYSFLNRSPGPKLLGRTTSPTVIPQTLREEQGGLWALEVAGDGIGIVNTDTIGALDHFAGGSTIEAYPNNGTSDPYHQWLPVQVADRLPSFALVNSRTGRSLAFKSSTEENGIIMSANTINEWSNQWYFENLSGFDSDTPLYAVINKLSGTVLDHFREERIEAQTDDTSIAHHRWKLLPCPFGENYFQIQNAATNHYLEELVDGVPNATSTTSMENIADADKARSQCWELVSIRRQDFDLITLDDDILQGSLPFFQPSDSDTLRHRIVKRAPRRDKKGKNKDAHKPQNPRLLRDVSPFILAIFNRVIDEWVEDRLPTTVQAGTRVSTNRQEVETRWGNDIPRSLMAGSDRDGWIRIDIQGTYETSPGVRVANIQGQWNNNSVFHVIVPLGVTVGRETIREAMRTSLNLHTSITIEPANSKPPAGGKKPNSTPKPPPGPGGSGNGWIYTAAAIVANALAFAGIMTFL